jgi:hypothetical protein
MQRSFFKSMEMITGGTATAAHLTFLGTFERPFATMPVMLEAATF